eukprot:3934094-Rhodomonas_salina.8
MMYDCPGSHRSHRCDPCQKGPVEVPSSAFTSAYPLGQAVSSNMPPGETRLQSPTIVSAGSGQEMLSLRSAQNPVALLAHSAPTGHSLHQNTKSVVADESAPVEPARLSPMMYVDSEQKQSPARVDAISRVVASLGHARQAEILVAA